MYGLLSLLKYFPDSVKKPLEKAENSVTSRITELRIRKNGPLVIIIRNKAYFIDSNGDIYDYPTLHSVCTDSECFQSIFMELCSYSVFTHSEELKKGYITLENGARVGVASSAVYENGNLVSVKDISSLNIRIPRDIKGCSDALLNMLYVNSFPSIIVSGLPNSGKTTLLRDTVRNLSDGFNGNYRKITVIDERLEFTGTDGKTYELGANTDVLSGFRKEEAIEIALRSLSPEMIVCDEISTPEQVNAVKYGFLSGVRFALSVHAGSRKELFGKSVIKELLKTGEFSYVVLLDGYSYTYDIFETVEVEHENGGNTSSDYLFNRDRFTPC